MGKRSVGREDQGQILVPKTEPDLGLEGVFATMSFGVSFQFFSGWNLVLLGIRQRVSPYFSIF